MINNIIRMENLKYFFLLLLKKKASATIIYNRVPATYYIVIVT